MNTNFFKKLIFGFAVLAIAAIVVFNINANSKRSGLSDIFLAKVEALAQNEGEEPERIICRCTDGNIFGANKQCKANGDNAKCAQSAPGGNIDCSDYNANC